MSRVIRVGWIAVCGIAALLATDTVCFAQGPTDNPYRPVRGLADGGGPSVPGGEWARLPGGREMGPPASVHVDIDGESIWAFIRCDETSPVPVARGGRFGIDCMNADGTLKPHDTIYKFDSKGNVVQSFGARMFIWPHGMHVDREGNVWVTDSGADSAVAAAAKAGVKAGHIVRKFSPDGQVLMTLGERRRRRRVSFQVAGRCRDGSQWRHLRRRRSFHQQPDREVLEGREVHQGLGENRIRAGRIPGPALH
jgi:hypothetical protein